MPLPVSMPDPLPYPPQRSETLSGSALSDSTTILSSRLQRSVQYDQDLNPSGV